LNILNLTQHAATAEQLLAGVVEPHPAAKLTVKEVLTFEELPSAALILQRAETLAMYASDHTHVMIGGAPFFMGPLEQALRRRGVTPLYAFTRRETEEVHQPDGSVKKTAVFKHAGFVWAVAP